jgi:hypothetical protein
MGATSLAELTVAANSTVGGASGKGGGIFAVVSVAATAVITSSTLNGNAVSATAAAGGNLDWVPGVTIANSVISGGIGPAGNGNCNADTRGASLGFNLESLDQCGFRAAGDLVNRDPLLGPLQNNGGPTATMLPTANSPLVDKGSATGADQGGLPRPIDFLAILNSTAPGANAADIGAVERQPVSAFSLGRLKRLPRRGTALLTVTVPDPAAGTLTLSGPGLRTRTVALTGTTTVLKVEPTGAVRKALRRHGRRKVGIVVTYAPAGAAAASSVRKATLTQKRRLRKRRPKHPAHR